MPATAQPLRIVFLACTRDRRRYREDPSFIYRCENLGLALASAGHEVKFLHLTEVSRAFRFDVAVFHRPQASWQFRLVHKMLSWSGVFLCADVDDLVFDPEYVKFSPAVLNRQMTPAKVLERFNATRRALAHFSVITTSTHPLLLHLRRCFPSARVAVLPNAAHHEWQKLPRIQEQHPDRPSIDVVRRIISYTPGTRSHDRDFLVYAPAIGGFLDKYPNVCLEVTGSLNVTITARPGQIRCSEKVPFKQFHQRYTRSWVNLAPLEQTPFTQCKSALKVIEAGFWGVPTVCSAIPDTRRFEKAGALLANDSQACFDWLESMLSPKQYLQTTNELSERVKRMANAQAIGDQFVTLVRKSFE
jgi:glycosyltransferase involved in cell wall biosynthesis